MTILHEKIIKERFYWNNITQSCKDFIKNCEFSTIKNKIIFLPPPSNHILCYRPKELYVIEITEIPNELKSNDNEKLYLLSIIDHFSKYAQNYIFSKKTKILFYQILNYF